MSIPDDVRAFLEEIAGDDDLVQLEHDVELWKNSPDLNEGWISNLRLRARLLLNGFGGSES